MSISASGILDIDVIGVPAPQGSKRHVGGGRMIESSKAVGPWREAVRAETQHQTGGRQAFYGPVWVEVTFRLPRPKGHHGARGLLPSAPHRPHRKPDLDKLLRAVLDGITDGGAIGDDAQVCVVSAEKGYASDGLAPGAFITIGELS